MKAIALLFELQTLEAAPDSSQHRARVDGLRREVPAPILAHYDRLVQRGKRGVALVRRGVCTGCQMRLATGIHAALVRDEDITMCDTCARYLLLAPEAPETLPSPKVPGRRGRRKKAGLPAVPSPA
jgi:predicted  nucleic acid-binding Zn-ribbon protein